METLERIIQQAGNDPLTTGFSGLTITSATDIRVLSDLTGSAGPASPDKGDPDGDTNDSGEDVRIRFDVGDHAIELVVGGTAQPIANNISDFSLQFFDRDGVATNVGDDVRRIRISLTGASPVPDPQTGHTFSLHLSSDVQLAVRQ